MNQGCRLNKEQIQKFASEHQLAMMLMHQGTEDYAAARCCLLNGHFPGLTLAAQAVEKYLKAYINFLDSKNSKRYGHDLNKLADLVEQLDENISFAPVRGLLDELIVHYEARYPETNNVKSSSTSLVHKIDSLMIFLALRIPIPMEVKYRSGLFGAVTSSLNGKVASSVEEWLKRDNIDLNLMWSSIEKDHRSFVLGAN